MDAELTASGAHRPTMNDVAARAGVSRALVSIVVRGAPGASAQTRDRVLRAARELGYQRDGRARALRTGRSHHLGLVFDARDDFHADLLEAFYPAADAAGYELLLSAVTASRDQDAAIAALVSSRVEGVVVLGSRAGPGQPADPAVEVPVVVVGSAEDGVGGVDVVRTDEELGVGQAVDHLVGLGHRDLVCLEAPGRPAGRERVQAHRAAVARHGLPVRVLPGGFTHRAGREAAAALLRSPRPLPTAVLASNDACAAGVVQTLRAAGVDVPGRVSVVGFDGSHLASSPDLELSTVAQDAAGLAQLATAVLVARIAGAAGQGDPRALPPDFRVGATTGPAPDDPR